MRIPLVGSIAFVVACSPASPPPAVATLASLAANSVLAVNFEAAPSGQTTEVELFFDPAGEASSDLPSSCAPFDPALAATFNATPMALQAQEPGACAPAFMLTGADLGIGGTIVVRDSTATWTAIIQPAVVPLQAAWIEPTSSVLQAGDSIQIQVSPAPGSVTQLELTPTDPSQLVVISPAVVSLIGSTDGGEPFLGNTFELFDGGFRADAATSQVDFTLPSGAGIAPGPATLSIETLVPLPSASTGPSCQAFWHNLFTLPATIEP